VTDLEMHFRNLLKFISFIMAISLSYGVDKLTEEDINDFHTKGIVVCENLFNSDEILETLQSLNRLHQVAQQFFDYICRHETNMAENGVYVHKSEDSFRIAKIQDTDTENKIYHLDWQGTRFVIGKTARGLLAIHRIVWAGSAEPALISYGRSEKILKRVAQLLESDQAYHLINQLHPKIPGDDVEFPWHQDVKNRRSFDPGWRDINGTGSFVQVIMALDPMTKDNGAFKVVGGLPEAGDLFLDTKSKENIEREVISAEYLELNSGDVVFMHPYCIHGSEPNNSGLPRRTFINGFSYPGANTKAYPGEGSAQLISLVPEV
jgi:hypothetical protein